MGRERLAAPDMERIFQGETVSGLSEWQLLGRYLEHRDELAFAALVARYGPMVMGTCRRMLSERADAEDAFQATFLVLVRRARSLGPRDQIGPWLHGVAARVSMRARSQAARRRRVEPSGGELSAVPAWTTSIDGELGAVIDQELDRLPAKYRSPIVLCYLQGLTHEEAARQLNWPLGSVKGRLSRARDLLRSRLLRRGIAPGVAIVGSSIGREASAAFDRALFEQTVNHCMAVSLKHASVDAVSVSIATLVKGALSAMMFEKLKWAGFATLATGLALAGAVVMAQPGGPPARQENSAKTRAIVADRLTRGQAASALGSGEKASESKAASSEVEDLRGRLIQAAKHDWTTALQDFRANKATLDRIYQASTRLMSAEQTGPGTVADQAAASAHAERMRDVARIQNANPARTDGQVSLVNAYSAEAELWMAQASARFAATAKAAISTSTAAPGGGEDAGESGIAEAGSKDSSGVGRDPRSRLILGKLEESVVMKFMEETPLEDIIKHIRESTKSSDMPGGIPIYVDPIGLSEADKTMTSTIRNMDLEGVPLHRTLQLALTQLGLFYFVQDGMLYITSHEYGGNPLPPAIPVATALSKRIGKAENGELTVDELKDLIATMKAQREVEGLRAGEFHDVVHEPRPPEPTEELKQNKQLIESLAKLTQSLLEELKEARKAKQPEKPETPAAPTGGAAKRNLQ